MDNSNRAVRLAVKYLSSRMYTKKELYDKLLRAKCGRGEAEEAVVAVAEQGYLDDYKYAEMYILDSANLNHKGEYRIRRELAQKGVSREDIDRAFLNTDADIRGALDEYVRLRFDPESMSGYKEREKFKAQLIRRGYSLSDINDSINEFLETVENGGE